MNISGEVVRTSQLPKKTLGLNDSLVALMSSPLETVTVPVSDFVSFVATQLILAGQDSLDSVTTVGNTTANTITIGGATSPYYQLNTLSPGTQGVGRFLWNDVDGTVDLGLKGGNVTLQLGQETVVRVVNKTNANLLESEYKVVRVRVASEGGAQGQRLAVVLAQGNNDPDSVTTLGIVTENINNNQEGFITVFGNVNNINTTGSLQGETWADGDVLFLSPTTPGALTKVKPQAPNHTVVMGYVVYAHQNNGKIFVKVDNGYEIDELHNVKITNVLGNDLLQYDSIQQVWKNVAASVAFPTPTLASVTTAGNTTTNAITVGGLTTSGNIVFSAYNRTIGSASYPASAIYTGELYSMLNIRSGGNTNGLSFYDNGGTLQMRIWGTGNVTINSATDAGYKLDVNGSTRVKGTGSTSATTGLLVQNSAGTDALKVRDDGVTLIGSNRITFNGNNITFEATGIVENLPEWRADATGVKFGNYGSLPLRISIKGTENARFFTTGNVSIGTTTDAGYKLDVAGTGRFTGNLTVSTGGTGTNTFNANVNYLFANQNNVYGIVDLQNAANQNAFLKVTGSPTTGTVFDYFWISGTTTSSTVGTTRNIFNISPTYNLTGAFTGTMRGFYYNPVLTSMTGATHRAIETVSGDVILGSTSGDVSIGTATLATSTKLTLAGSETASSAIARGQMISTTLVAAANNDVLVGLDIAPTFTNGAFTGVANAAIRVQGWNWTTTGIVIGPNNTVWNSSTGPVNGFVLDVSGIYARFRNGSGSGFGYQFITNNSVERLRITDANVMVLNTNMLVGTTTDAGYKLDVNGTARISGQVDIAPGLSTLQINAVTQVNSRLIQFNTNGSTGGYNGGYEFRTGYGGGYGTTTAFRIWSSNVTNRVGVGDLSEANLQGGNAQVYINNQITGGRNAGVRISPAAASTTQYNGIQFDLSNKDSQGGVFLGSQYNPLSNGYDVDLVVLTTSHNVSSYAETARFIGKYNSFYVGTDKTLAVASAKLQVESTTQGFLGPRMTTAQILAISTPAEGLQVYNTDLHTICFFDGTIWQKVISSVM